MNLGINKKTVLVTGAGRGIGLSICKSFIREGVNVVAVSRSKNHEIEKVIGENKNNLFITLDFEKKNAIKKMFNIINKKKIKIDIIINNVGGDLNLKDPLMDIISWKKVFKINLEVAIQINNLFIKQMVKRKWGRICHISSISALENQGTPAYCASKAALNAYVRSVGRYLCKDNVIMTSIMPGAIFTSEGYWDTQKKKNKSKYKKYIKERMAIKRIGESNEISELVLVLCSQLASFCVGTNLLVDGGWTSI